MELESYVSDILGDIREEGVEALKRYSKKFDDYEGRLKLTSEDLVTEDEVPTEDKEAIREVIERVKDFHERYKVDDRTYRKNGSTYGLLYRAIDRVGLYVPGGRPLPSSLIMMGVPALLAGVKEIVVTTPPKNGEISPYVRFVADELGIEEIYRLGGVQAIGAMAYGVGMKKVDKIFGPGNKYVTEAKRQVFGEVGIDQLAGPSEICIVADGSADKDYVLEDLKSQLEHGAGSKAWLFTTSKSLAEGCSEEGIESQWFEDIDACMARANEVAPEHLEIMTEEPRELLDSVKNAGAVYLGDYTPVAAADYFIGVNHVLPTGSAAKFSSVLTVMDFMKAINLAYLDKEEFMDNRELGSRLAEIEDMKEHKESIEVRK